VVERQVANLNVASSNLVSRSILKDFMSKLRRSRKEKWFGGICGGFSAFFDVEPWVVRLLTVLLTLFGGMSILIYLILWVFIPREEAV
jgi:phage shock protein C